MKPNKYTVSCETRLINRRCRCGKPFAETSNGCHWHAAGSTRYVADLLAYVAATQSIHKDPWQRIAMLVRKWKGDRMNVYMFEYLDDGRPAGPVSIRATNTVDAFDAFRADYPAVPIAYVWIELFGNR